MLKEELIGMLDDVDTVLGDDSLSDSEKLDEIGSIINPDDDEE